MKKAFQAILASLMRLPAAQGAVIGDMGGRKNL